MPIDLKNISAIAFDLDGTLYNGNLVADGAIDLITYLIGKRKNIFYFTNNSKKTRDELFTKLLKMGFKLNLNQVYCSSYAVSLYCREKKLKKVYCIGSEGLISELDANGIKHTSTASQVDAVVIGLDENFTYHKITAALNYLLNGSKLIICNRDKNYPVENNIMMPGCGSIVSAIETAYGKTADFMAGKPSTYMIDLLIKDWKITSNKILIIGDSYDSDIQMANNIGSSSILISKFFDFNIKDTIICDTLISVKKLLS